MSSIEDILEPIYDKACANDTRVAISKEPFGIQAFAISRRAASSHKQAETERRQPVIRAKSAPD